MSHGGRIPYEQELEARIAELEAEIPAQQQITINALARIAELEAEVKRLEAKIAKLLVIR